jgi:hypothetical protein
LEFNRQQIAVQRQETMRPNSKLIKATLTGALGGLLYGFDTVVISGIIEPVTRLYNLSSLSMGVTVAASPVGTIVGCFAAGVIGQSGTPRPSTLLLPFAPPFRSAGPCCWRRALWAA